MWTTMSWLWTCQVKSASNPFRDEVRWTQCALHVVAVCGLASAVTSSHALGGRMAVLPPSASQLARQLPEITPVNMQCLVLSGVQLLHELHDAAAGHVQPPTHTPGLACRVPAGLHPGRLGPTCHLEEVSARGPGAAHSRGVTVSPHPLERAGVAVLGLVCQLCRGRTASPSV